MIKTVHKNKKEYVLFDSDSIFSLFHKHKFRINLLDLDNPETLEFETVSTFYKYLKFKKHNDTNNMQKLYSKQHDWVMNNMCMPQNFDEAEWLKCRDEFMYSAICAKFTDQTIRHELMQYSGSEFVYCSGDLYWGAGISINTTDEQFYKADESFLGNNALGKILTRVANDGYLSAIYLITKEEDNG